MWNGKKKAITFSFDDGVRQDIRAIEILNKYGLKGTFNLNSERFGAAADYRASNGQWIERRIVLAEEVAEVYKGHEVAVHTLAHPNLTGLEDAEVIRQVDEDRRNLERLCGYNIFGMAYPCGGVNNDDRVAGIIAKNTPIQYARTITSTHSFEKQENLLRFNPTLHFRDEKLFALAEEFLALQTDKPQIFYIWGHTYELDLSENEWVRFEEFCKLIANKDDIYYGTNGMVLLGE